MNEKLSRRSRDGHGETSGLRRYAVFGVVALALLISSMNLTVAFVAIPQIAQGLGASLVWVGWTITGYQLAQSVSMSLVGRVSDQYGHKRVFLGGLAVFCVGSLGAGVAPDIATHVVLRVVAALGGGAIMPVAAALVTMEFPRQRARAIGLFTSVLPLGWIIGPTVGGLAVGASSWRWAFFLPVPLAMIAAALGVFILRESRGQVQQRLDVAGAALLAAGTVAFMLGMALLRTLHGAVQVGSVALLLVSVPLLLAFWRHEERTEEPILDPALLRLRPFVVSNGYGLVWGGVSIGSSAFVPLYAMTVYGLAASQAGAMLVGLEAALILGSTATSLWLIGRLSYRPLILVGLAILAASLVAVGFGVADRVPGVAPRWVLFIVLTIAGLGMGLQAPASNNAGIELLPSRLSSIVGLRGMFRTAGSVVGTTVVFFVLAGYADQARGLEHVYLGMGLLLAASAPLVAMMPTGREKPLTEEAVARISRYADRVPAKPATGSPKR